MLEEAKVKAIILLIKQLKTLLDPTFLLEIQHLLYRTQMLAEGLPSSLNNSFGEKVNLKASVSEDLDKAINKNKKAYNLLCDVLNKINSIILIF